MTVQSDKWIKKMVKDHSMILPFEEKQVRNDKISFGVSSYGYDARVSDEFKIFTNVNSEIVDPKNFKLTILFPKIIRVYYSTKFIRSCSTVEYFKIPKMYW